MEIFRLDKAINNEKLDLEMTITQLKKAKEKLSQFLKKEKILKFKSIIISTLNKKLKTIIQQVAQMKI